MGQTYAYAPVEDLILPQGITLPKTYTVRDKNGAVVNVTGGAVRMTFRGRYGGTALLNCVCSVVSGPSGDVQCVAEAADTAAVTRARGVYDGEVELPSGDIYRFVEGAWNLSRGVS